MTHTQVHDLISQVIDGEERDQDWQQFVSLADRDSKLWRELAEAQRDDRAVRLAVSDAGVAAESIRPGESRPQDSAQHVLRFTGLTSWSGWAVAALVAIVALARMAPTTGPVIEPRPADTHLAGVVPFSTAADAFQAYLDIGQESGQVIGEMPEMVLLESRPAEVGTGFEIVFVRQVLERTVVPDLYQIQGLNEFGQPTLIRYETKAHDRM